ncbi:MAG: dTMP kinase [Anaerolineaceae bacterium]|nr:dTMP kinase [Anaerolineaceae bacterium]
MFITLEGPDGSGKTSQMEPLAAFLREHGYDVVTTREPGGTPISNQVREILLNRMENTAMHPRTEILLFCASRAQHVEEFIRPQLADGKIVICDRYADSTLAYQGYGHGVDIEVLKNLLNFTTGGLFPDLTLLLDVKAEIGLRRRQKGGEEWNRLDAYAVKFHCRVQKGYHQLVEDEPHRWQVIDAEQSPELVQKEMQEVILNFLSNQNSIN